MNLDKITIDDIMEFWDIEEYARQILEVRVTVQKFMNIHLSALAENPEFIQFYKRRYPDEE